MSLVHRIGDMRAFQSTAEWLRLFFDPTLDPGRWYDLAGPTVLHDPGSSEPLTNMGLWEPGDDVPRTLGAANEALFARVADGARVDEETVSVVDVGCGFGRFALWLAGRSPRARVVGVNVSRSQVEAARSEADVRGLRGRVSFVEADATHLPMADASVEVVVSTEAGSSREHASREPHTVTLRDGVPRHAASNAPAWRPRPVPFGRAGSRGVEDALIGARDGRIDRPCAGKRNNT